jgi:hypothetical protein
LLSVSVHKNHRDVHPVLMMAFRRGFDSPARMRTRQNHGHRPEPGHPVAESSKGQHRKNGEMHRQYADEQGLF